jgi:ferredoxin
MTFVVTEQCIKCRFTDCVVPCPVDCFHEGEDFMVIDPEACIDCNVCATECPVNAIYQDKDLPEDQKIFISINRELAKIYRPVTSKSGPAPEAEKWRGVADKRKLLDLQDIDFDMPA